MFKRFTLNRFLIGALAVCVLIVSGSLLYYRDTKIDADRAKAETEARIKAHSERMKQQADTGGTSPVDFGDAAPTLDTEDTPPVSNDTAEDSTIETDAEVLEGIELSETDTAAADEPAEEVAVSPYGFGPYPVVPEDFPWGLHDPEEWKSASMENELMARVLVKIWTEEPGSISGGSTKRVNGQLRILPHYHNAVYVTWTERIGLDGKVYRYISSTTSGYYPEIGASIEETGEIPAGFRVLDYEKDSIDPYTFLELPE